MTPRHTTPAVSQQLDTLRERHVRHGEVWWNGDRVDSGDYCCACMGSWPCDAIQQADRADTAEALLHEAIAALRDAVDVAHETDSLRSHSDDERRDGWFRAPLYRCGDATCMEATAIIRRYDAQYTDTVVVAHTPDANGEYPTVKDEGRRP